MKRGRREEEVGGSGVFSLKYRHLERPGLPIPIFIRWCELVEEGIRGETRGEESEEIKR
jgi:hypothetical protein